MRSQLPSGSSAASGLAPNPDFLSLDLFYRFLVVIDPLLGMMDALIFEFEYLNKQKMADLGQFLEAIDAFISRIPAGLPIALEPRNGNYMKVPYFDFIRSKDLIHVYDMYSSFKNYFTKLDTTEPAGTDSTSFGGRQGPRSVVVRLLGGDRRHLGQNRHAEAGPSRYCPQAA